MTLDVNRIYGILKKLNLDQAKKYTREDLIKVTDEGRATYTASGSLMKAGESIVIMLTVQKPRTGEVIDSVKLTCQNEADILSKTDELAAKIKSALNLSPAQIATDKGLEIQKITASPEALKYYLESRKYYLTAEYAKVIGLCEKAIEIDPKFALAYYQLNGAYRGLRNGPKAKETIAKAFELRDRITARERYLIEGNYYQEMDEKAPDKAIEALKKYLELSPDDATEIAGLGYIYMNFGDLAKSLELMKEAYGIAPSFQTLGSLIAAYEPMGLYKEAAAVSKEYLKDHAAKPEETAAELKVLGEKYFNKQNRHLYNHLQGLIYLEKGDYPKAAESLRTACSMLWSETIGATTVQPHAFYIYPLAFACYKSGDLERARKEYEKVTSLTTGRLCFGDLYAKSFYWLGKIAEDEKDKGRARENFRRFLDLWKDADPGQPEVDDANARLAALKY